MLPNHPLEGGWNLNVFDNIFSSWDLELALKNSYRGVFTQYTSFATFLYNNLTPKGRGKWWNIPKI